MCVCRGRRGDPRESPSLRLGVGSSVESHQRARVPESWGARLETGVNHEGTHWVGLNPGHSSMECGGSCSSCPASCCPVVCPDSLELLQPFIPSVTLSLCRLCLVWQTKAQDGGTGEWLLTHASSLGPQGTQCLL